MTGACVLLVLFTVFVLLDTFAIARVQMQVVDADTTSITTSGAALPVSAQADAESVAYAASVAEEGDSADASQAGSDGAGNVGASAGVVYSNHKESFSAASADTANSSDGQTDTQGSDQSETQDDGLGDASDASAVSADGAVESSESDGEYAYADENVSISVSTLHAYDTDIYIADIQVSSAEYLKTALAQNAFGRNLKDTTSNMAEEAGAVLAINGDYYGFRDDGYVVRNGVLYRDQPSVDTDALVIYGDGTMGSADQNSVSAQELVEAGAWQVLSFGPVLIEDGVVCVSEGQEVSGKSMGSNPRTAIGMISPLHYLVVVSDGRTGDDAGLSLAQLASVMSDAGAMFAYNLDGGGSTTMWFQGTVLNDPASGNRSGEREVSDIVYFG